MFDGFARKSDQGAGRRFAVSTLASIVAYAAIGSAALWAAQRSAQKAAEEDEIAVKFKAPEPATPKPKAPPPPVVVPETMKVKRSAAARPAPSLVAPKEISEKKLDEATPTDAVEVGEGAGGDPGAGSGPVAEVAKAAPPPPPPPPPPPKRSDPISLPEDAEPPEPDEGNATPAFPEAMRVAGKEGLVILKIVVTDKGHVGKIEVLRGEEPFIQAALDAVKTWKFSPAMVENQPTAVYRIIKIPFRLKT